MFTQVLPLSDFAQTATCQASETFAHVALAIASAEVVVDTCQLILFHHLAYYAKYVITLFIHLLSYMKYRFYYIQNPFPIATMCNKHVYISIVVVVM